MSFVLAVFELDDERMETEGYSFDGECGWMCDSGIYLQGSREVSEEEADRIMRG